jgi:pimeloyl-ACP methyl ester carboxylesterase
MLVAGSRAMPIPLAGVLFGPPAEGSHWHARVGTMIDGLSHRWVRTHDGVEVATRRRGPDLAPVALVLAHGFSMTSSDWRLTAVADGLAAVGHAVFTFDFRGHGRSGGISTLGDQEIFDLDAVVRLARQHGHRKIVVIGASMGGFVSLRHAALLGGEDAVIAISTPATWGISHRIRGRALFLVAQNRIGRQILSSRGTRVMERLPGPALSPSDLVGRIKIPVALIHGDRDPYVPINDALLLHERLGGPKRLITLAGFGHAEAAYTPGLAARLSELVDEMLRDAIQPVCVSRRTPTPAD